MNKTVLEVTQHYSEEDKRFLIETRVFTNDKMTASDLTVLDCDKGKTIEIDDVWIYQWKLIDKKSFEIPC